MKLMSLLVLVFFYDALLTLLLPSTVTAIFPSDGSVALFIVSIAALYFAYPLVRIQSIKPVPNAWIFLLFAWAVFSHFQSPNVRFESSFLPKDNGIYNFKPLVMSFLFLLMLWGIVNRNIPMCTLKTLGGFFAWTAIVYSGYVILQSMGLDQLYQPTNDHIDNPHMMGRNPRIGGLIGQPVFCAAVIACLLPFVLKHKGWFGVGFCLLAVHLTGNRSGLCVSLFVLLYMTKYFHRTAIILAFIYVVALIVLTFISPKIHLISDTGRFATWLDVIKDIFNPAFPGISKTHILTGYGLGSFAVFFPFYHESPFFQAHNEALEVLYTLGFIGLAIFWKAWAEFYKKTANCDIAILASISALVLLSMTNPIWHVPQLAFLTVLLIGLAYNRRDNVHI